MEDIITNGSLDWFMMGAQAAREGCERDRPPMALRVEGKETDLTKWLRGHDSAGATEDADPEPDRPDAA